MNSRGCSPTAATSPTLFKSNTSFDSAQDCFDLDLRKDGDKAFTIVLPSNASYSDMSMQLEYDKSGDINSPMRSGVGTPTTSSSDGEYSTKLLIPSEVTASSSVGSPELDETTLNGIHLTNTTGYQNGTLKPQIRDSFSPSVSSPTKIEGSESQESKSEVVDLNGRASSPTVIHQNGDLEGEASSQISSEKESEKAIITNTGKIENGVTEDTANEEEIMNDKIASGVVSPELLPAKGSPDLEKECPPDPIDSEVLQQKPSTSIETEEVTTSVPVLPEPPPSPVNNEASKPASPLAEPLQEKPKTPTESPSEKSPQAEASSESSHSIQYSQNSGLKSDNIPDNLNVQTNSPPKINNSSPGAPKNDDVDKDVVKKDNSEAKSPSVVDDEGDDGSLPSEKEIITKEDTLNATIERVALREREIARARKEAEEAARKNFSPNSQPPLKKFRKNYVKMVQVEEQQPPEASTSSAADETENISAALPPLEPIDTDVNAEDDSTPLATPSEAGSQTALFTSTKAKPRRRRERATPSVFCGFEDSQKGKCKQRAILQFQYCIRHILSDPNAPYKRCQHQRRAKTKKDPPVQCTNAISRDNIEIFCTTHLIMKGLREPKKKKKTAGDDASTVSVDGSESFDPNATNHSSNFVDEISMNSFNEDQDSSFETQSFNGYEHSQEQWPNQQSQNGAEYSSLEPQHPSTSYFTPSSQQVPFTPNGEAAQPPSHTYQLIQKPNGEQVLVDEYGTAQPPGSYSLVQGPNGSLQATFIQNGGPQTPQTPCSSIGFPSQTPPGSAPPTFGDHSNHEFRRPSVPMPPQRFQSVDGTPLKTFEHSPFPPHASSTGPQAIHPANQISKQHPQLSARLLQSHSSSHSSTSSTPFDPSQMSQSQFIVQSQPHSFQTPQIINGAPYNEVLIQQPDGTFIQHPSIIDHHPGMEMPPPPLPPSRAESRAASTTSIPPSNIRTIVTYPNGQTHVLPLGTRIVQTANGTTAIIPPQPMPEPMIPIIQQPQVATPENSVIGNRAPDPFLYFERPPKYIKPDNIETDSEDEEIRMQKDYGLRRATHARKDKMICLRQKRQRMRIGGSFRKIPAIDEMAKALENHDFDKTDLFPLGLEPSDEDESSDEDCLEFGPRWWPPNGTPRNTAIEVYLQKKVLKLEKSKLIKNAIITAPLMSATKMYPNSAGAALRTRDHHRRGLSRPENKPLRERRCYHMLSDGIGNSRRTGRCPHPCLPRTNHCSDHILYNIDQKLFDYCARDGCSRPVLPSEAAITNGMCRHHFEQQENRHRIPQQLQGQQFVFPPSRPSSARYVVTHYPPAPANVTPFDNSSTVLSSATVLRTSVNAYATQMPQGAESRRHPAHVQPVAIPPFKSPSTICYDEASTSVMYFDNHNYDANHDNDDGDVSLASVAKDLGINSDALNEVLASAQVGEDEPMDCDDDDRLIDDDKDNLDLGHNWADVEQFLLSEGYPVDNVVDGDVSGIPSSGFVDDDPSHGFVNASHGFGSSSNTFDSLIYHDLH